MYLIKAITLSSLILGLTSCQTLWKKRSVGTQSKLTPYKNVSYANNTDARAKKITAKYSKEYNLSGNIIADYEDFQVELISTEIRDTETISTFEITSRLGKDKKQLRSSTKEPEKKYFYLEDMHFFYHSSKPGKINIYIPPILTA